MFDDYYLLVVKIKSLRRNDYECEVLIVRLNSASEFKRIVPMRIYLRIKTLDNLLSRLFFANR